VTYCTNCGTEIRDEGQFCGNCGERLSGDTSQSDPGHSSERRTPRQQAGGHHSSDRQQRRRRHPTPQRRQSGPAHEPPGPTHSDTTRSRETVPAPSDRHNQGVDPQSRRPAGPDGRAAPSPPSGYDSGRGSDDPSDPVQDSFAGETDLYEIATWEVRSPLDRVVASLAGGFSRARRALLVVVAVLLLLGQAGTAVVAVLEEPLLGALAVTSLAPALVVAFYIWYDDPTAREPFVTLAATFVLAIAFSLVAALVNSTVGPEFEAFGAVGVVSLFFLVVGPIEEFVKWLAIRVYAYRTDIFQTVVDGAVYGAVAGLGFAAIENFIYIATVYFEAAPDGTTRVESAVAVTTQRLFAGPGHVVFSAWAGFYLGLAKFNPENRGPIILKGLLIAAFIHGLYNTLVTLLPPLLPVTVLTMFVFIILYHAVWFGLLYRKVSSYQRLYRQRLSEGATPPRR
jgi:RsiW-degrading membrane proteinase PrsW (M82 family)